MFPRGIAFHGGVPLLNGYVSKELIYEGSIQAGYPVLINIPGMNLTIFGIIGWITSGLTFICLIHAFYVIFLGKPKDELKDVKDPPLYMMIPIMLMATLCIVVGLFPGLVSGAVQFAAAVLYGIRI